MHPTVVLVHGAFAESASWDRVITLLRNPSHPLVATPNPIRDVIAAANPLRGLGADADAVGALVGTIDGPVVLVGHSYGGAVISNVAADSGQIVGLVYVAAFAPDAGEDCVSLSQRFPGSTLGDTLQPVSHGDGTTDLYIDRSRFHAQFCADVPATHAAGMAATQRPVTLTALAEPSEVPLWRTVPSWFVIPTADRNIPAELQRFMAVRAGARSTVEVPGASHAVSVSRPEITSALVVDAAESSVAVSRAAS